MFSWRMAPPVSGLPHRAQEGITSESALLPPASGLHTEGSEGACGEPVHHPRAGSFPKGREGSRERMPFRHLRLASTPSTWSEPVYHPRPPKLPYRRVVWDNPLFITRPRRPEALSPLGPQLPSKDRGGGILESRLT